MITTGIERGNLVRNGLKKARLQIEMWRDAVHILSCRDHHNTQSASRAQTDSWCFLVLQLP